MVHEYMRTGVSEAAHVRRVLLKLPDDDLQELSEGGRLLRTTDVAKAVRRHLCVHEVSRQAQALGQDDQRCRDRLVMQLPSAAIAIASRTTSRECGDISWCGAGLTASASAP